MLGLLSKLNIVDNSGITLGRLIKILKPNKKHGAKIGDIVLISTLKSLSTSKFTKGSLAKALIIRTKFSKFGDNAAIIINDKLLPVGSRIRGPLPNILNKNLKLITITAPSIII